MNPFQRIVAPITEVIGYILPVALALVASIGTVWCIVLGVKLAKAEEPQEREKAKSGLKNAIIGFVLIFILLAMLSIATEVLTKWLETYYDGLAALIFFR